MRLISLQIYDASDPNHLVIGFDDGSPLEQTVTTAIVGQNGSGKSRLLESLVLIFRDLDLGRPPAFPYELVYSCRDRQIEIDADPHREPDAQMLIRVDGTQITYAELVQDPERRYLPSRVIGYQAGPSNQMAELFSLHEQRFYQALIQGHNPLQQNIPTARLMQSQFALLPFFQKQDPFFQELLEQTLGLEGVVSVLPIVRKLPWSSQSGNIPLWDALEMTRQFLDYTLSLALAPVPPLQRALRELKESPSAGQLRLYVRGEDEIRVLESIYTMQQEIALSVASTYISKLLSETKMQVELHQASGSSTVRDLSSGEQQLLTVLSLLHFIPDEEALFLLDGPDTYLHPEWCLWFLEYINQVKNTKRSHLILTSHNPLTISSLEPRQVRVLSLDRKTRKVAISTPTIGPRAIGVDSILAGEIFGLRFALDLPTQRLLDERRSIAYKDQLTLQERQRLGQLDKLLEWIDFSIGMRDRDFAVFIKKLVTREDPAIRQKVTLTHEQREERNKLINEIFEEMEKEGILP